DPGRGTSRVAAGMLAPVTEATFGEERLLALTLESARRFPTFLEELADATGCELPTGAPGTLFVAVDRDQLEALRRLYEFQVGLGLPVEWLHGQRCRGLEPALHPGLRAGILAPGHEVDPRALTRALASAVVSAGGRLRSGARVIALTCDRGRVTGVRLAGGEEIPATRVVVAAGCWSAEVEGVPESLARALRPVKGQILRLAPRRGDALPLTHLVRTEEVYLVPRRQGELVVGATFEEQGFDTSLTAGGIYELLRAGIEVAPAVRELELVEASAGLRPGTPDNAPLLGPAGPEGLVIATGHFRHGILLAPVTADAIASLLAKDDVPEEIRPFSPDRFSG
ncbi:MAG: glycine oxidase ThiO, partial [Actinomycetota bacterium]